MTPRGPDPRAQLARLGARPRKSLGQNFLTDVNLARRIAEAATTPAGGTVVEIGPGLGALTRHLASRAQRLVAIERDGTLARALDDEVGEGDRVVVVEADALRVDWAESLASGPAPHVLVGNLPYCITGPVLRAVRPLVDRIDRAVFMLQREVAERLLAAAGTKAYGALTVSTRALFEVTKLAMARPGAFFPAPKVDSAVVVLTPLPVERRSTGTAFHQVVEAGFATRRKMLRNAWRSLGLPADRLETIAQEAGVSLDARAEALSVSDFARMAEGVAAWLPPSG